MSSVKKLFNGIFAFALLFTFVCVSCKNDEDEVLQEEIDDVFVNANVENASEYSDVVAVKLMVRNIITGKYEELASSDWKEGCFTIRLPKILDSMYLRTPLFESSWPTVIDFPGQPTLIMSNRNIKTADAYFVGVNKYDNAIVTFSLVKIDVNDSVENAVGDGIKKADTEAFFTFVDSEVTISGYTWAYGYYIKIEGSLSPGMFIRTRNYSVYWRKGWNNWFFSQSIAREDDTMMETQQWSTLPVDGLKWYGSEKYLWLFENF